MPKRKPGQETLKDEGKEIILTADFGFVVAINSYGKDVSQIYSDLSSGMMPAKDIKHVLRAAMSDDIDDNYIEGLITRAGLQECAILAMHLLSHAMIGDVKKSKLAKMEPIQSLIAQFKGSHYRILWSLGLLWTATTIASTALVCGIFSL